MNENLLKEFLLQDLIRGKNRMGEKVNFTSDQVDILFMQAMEVNNLDQITYKSDGSSIFNLTEIRVTYPTGYLCFIRAAGDKELYISLMKGGTHIFGCIETSNGLYGYFFNKNNKKWRELQRKVINMISLKNKRIDEESKQNLDRVIYDMFPEVLEKDLLDDDK